MTKNKNQNKGREKIPLFGRRSLSKELAISLIILLILFEGVLLAYVYSRQSRFLRLELEKKVQDRTEELKQKNKQLVEAERLAALGKMANRVAHELRNPLTAVGGFARRINEKMPADDPNKKYLEMIVDKVITMESKVAEITRIQSQ